MSVRTIEATRSEPAGSRAPVVDLVVPVHNEAVGLDRSIRRLHRYLSERFPFDWRITIVDNGSADPTPDIAGRLAVELTRVRTVVLTEAGRGRALKAAWLASDADVVAYTDVDLSTDLDGLLPLVAPLLSGHSEVAIGSRLARGARVRRGLKREVISRGYNAILRLTLRTTFLDAQCGFKAIRTSTARQLLANVEDDGWFFDTELLVLAQRAGARIVEVPVDWVDDPDSRVRIVPTAWADLRGVWRLLATDRYRRPVRFAAVGVVSTVAYVLAYLLLRPAAGPWGANVLALAMTAVGNTMANRRYTFGIVSKAGRARHHLKGAVAFMAGLVSSSVGLALLHGAVHAPTAGVEAAVALTSGALGTCVRYVLFRNWVFAEHSGPGRRGSVPPPTLAAVRPGSPTPRPQPEAGDR